MQTKILPNGIIQLTDNNDNDFSAQIDGNLVVWYSFDGNDEEVYYYDGSAIVRLTDNDSFDYAPYVDDDRIVWQGFDGNDEEIYIWNDGQIVQLTNNDRPDLLPKISGNYVVWNSFDGNDDEIYYYDGKKNIQLTDNNFFEYNQQISGNKIVWQGSDSNDDEIYFYNGQKIIQLSNNDFWDYAPQISGNKVVWQGSDGNDDEIYYYDGQKVIQLTNDDYFDSAPQIDGEIIVWIGFDGNDNEVYLYNGRETIQLSNNESFDSSPQISGNKVVWVSSDGNDDEIYYYDGEQIIQLTDNDFPDYEPQIDGDKIVWSGLHDDDSEIYFYEITPGLELQGTENDDNLTGGKGPDTISGLGGDDTLQGLDSNDRLFGGAGNDLILGEDGSDFASGEGGNDTIYGGLGSDNLAGGEGRDRVFGEEGNDLLDGGSQSDRLLGGEGNDTIVGQSGNDTLHGGKDLDSLAGGAGNDRFFGQAGNDTLHGGDGADTLIGGLDFDRLDGQAGNDRLIGIAPFLPQSQFGRGEIDTLIGGEGRDIFVLGDSIRAYYDDGDPLTTGESDYAAIVGFNKNLDKLELHGADNSYKFDYFTTASGRIDIAVIYDAGITARGEKIAILQSEEDGPIESNSRNNRTNDLLNRLSSLEAGQDYVAGEVIIKFKSGADANAINSVQSRMGGRVIESTKGLGIQRWALNGTDLSSAIANFSLDSSIEYIEPNFIVSAAATIPNDSRFNKLWGLNNNGQTGGTIDADIDAPEAWKWQTGEEFVVGVIDSGVDYNHPDLNDNIWTNPGEIANNGIDDDENGYVDDYYGYDFVNDDSDPLDDNGHGTHVSGTIAAEGNNKIGVTGVNWNAKIMALKFLDSTNSGTNFDAIEAIEYATMMGVKLTNNSWSGYEYSQALYDAISQRSASRCAAAGKQGQLFVAAASNESFDNDGEFRAYPASYDLDNIISVAATDADDLLADFSNFGAISVDLAAPGVEIFSTLPDNTYGYLSGTSMATPHVVGVASLLWSENPDLSFSEIKKLILNSVDPTPALAGKTLTGGRLNAFNALIELAPPIRQIGTPNDDTLTGNRRRDLIFALAGNDTIRTYAGNDRLFGGDGNDLIAAGEGGDTLGGGMDNDSLFGSDGNDLLDGGLNNDRLVGGNGNDSLVAGSGADSLKGGLGNDSLNGGEGDDTIVGVVPGISSARELDVLTGGAGRDTFVLGDCSDIYYSDSDPLTTGESDYALITDLNTSEDFIQLHGSIEQYTLDFFTTSSGRIDAALLFDAGVAARAELIAIVQNVSANLNLDMPTFVFSY
jgi:Ca2+-binding RTX toxin-like protein